MVALPEIVLHVMNLSQKMYVAKLRKVIITSRQIYISSDLDAPSTVDFLISFKIKSDRFFSSTSYSASISSSISKPRSRSKVYLHLLNGSLHV